jgi:hypothetical protein
MGEWAISALKHLSCQTRLRFAEADGVPTSLGPSRFWAKMRNVPLQGRNTTEEHVTGKDKKEAVGRAKQVARTR